MGNLDGKVALVTGAARGQGRSHALTLAAAGADIVATDICAQIPSVPYPLGTAADLEATAKEVRSLGRRIVTVQADVRDVEAMTEATQCGVDELGRLDIVVANAGISGQASRAVSRIQAFRDTLEVNLTGTFITVEAARPHLISGGAGGSIVLVSSVAGLRFLGAGSGYTESKHGLVGLMRSLTKELAPHFIRVNSVHPTTVATPMILNERLYKQFRPDLEHPTLEDAKGSLATLNLLPVPYIESQDVSNAILFLVAETGRYITGVALPIDAGALAK